MTRSLINLLLVDDDEDDYILVRDSLKEIAKQVCAYKVEWAKSYREALSALDKHAHDVCVLDYHLGDHESSGLKLLAEARARNYAVPMIFFTGKGDHLIDLEAMRGGATDYLVKDSCTPELLERTIRYALEHFQQQDIPSETNRGTKWRLPLFILFIIKRQLKYLLQTSDNLQLTSAC